mmetsp:Transcript_3245/g.4432  ORF Transcript_3245/g.4432 Transcript_3245/m.4432 type:complete len:693 (-) Transcript_3245:231-2309(-)
MGNEISQQELEAELNDFGRHEFPANLDSPDVDLHINNGTTAPNCQPKHTIEEEERRREALKRAMALNHGEGVEVVSNNRGGKGPEFHLPDDGNHSAPLAQRERRIPSSAQVEAGSCNSKYTGDDNVDNASQQQKLSYLQMAKIGYQELVNAFIRPPRADYKVETLGPPAFNFCGRRFTRTDFALKTKRGKTLQCSHWEPVDRTSDRIPCVIYMHGNSSARVEVLPQLSYLLSLGVAVFSFDFAGSGQSDGEYVSLGYYEREDLMCVIAHLRNTNVVSTIALWGRSMGAATALMHGDRDPSIACMILDSSFADLTQLAVEMVEKGREQGIVVPQFVVNIAIRLIRNSVRKSAEFDIKHISPISHADKCFIPALFVAGEHDDFINPHHSQQIYAKYAGDKNIILVEGDHNSPRPKFMFDSASIFLQTCLQIPQSWNLNVHPGMNLMAPPWFYPGSKIYAGVKGKQNRKRDQQRHNMEQRELGMTAERQREIQASLFKMLGQPTEEPTAKKNEKHADPKPQFIKVNAANSSSTEKLVDMKSSSSATKEVKGTSKAAAHFEAIESPNIERKSISSADNKAGHPLLDISGNDSSSTFDEDVTSIERKVFTAVLADEVVVGVPVKSDQSSSTSDVPEVVDDSKLSEASAEVTEKSKVSNNSLDVLGDRKEELVGDEQTATLLDEPRHTAIAKESDIGS